MCFTGYFKYIKGLSHAGHMGVLGWGLFKSRHDYGSSPQFVDSTVSYRKHNVHSFSLNGYETVSLLVLVLIPLKPSKSVAMVLNSFELRLSF